MRSKFTYAGEAAEGSVLDQGHQIYRGRKRIGLLTRAERFFFVAVGIFGLFGVSAISLRLSWPLISVSNGGEETPLVSGTVDARTHDGYRPPRFTHGVTPTRETAQKDEPKGAIRTHPQASHPFGQGEKCTPAPAGSSRHNVPCVASAGRARAR